MLNPLLPSFRFRGKTGRLGAICQCFLDHPGAGLHPTQISRHTNIGFAEVSRRLDATPELFVKLPQRPDGITRYRLTSAMAARGPEAIAAFITHAARRESLLLYAVGSMLVCLMLIVAILVSPSMG